MMKDGFAAASVVEDDKEKKTKMKKARERQ